MGTIGVWQVRHARSRMYNWNYTARLVVGGRGNLCAATPDDDDESCGCLCDRMETEPSTAGAPGFCCSAHLGETKKKRKGKNDLVVIKSAIFIAQTWPVIAAQVIGFQDQFT